MAQVKLNTSRPQREASTHQPSLARDKFDEQTRLRSPHAHAEGREAVADAAAPTGFAHDFGRIPVLSRAPVSLQARLAVSHPEDAYEQEAERVAERVMRAPEPRLQRACACGGRCSDCQPQQAGLPDERLQMKGEGSSAQGRDAAPPLVNQVLASPGQPLDQEARAFFEPRFGYDFSRVRVHADTAAGQSARAVNALAYTVGQNVVFGAGRYAPGTQEGRRLLAHELTHVIQQGAGPAAVQREVGDTDSPTPETAGSSGDTGDAPVPLQDPPGQSPPGQTPPPAPGPKCAEQITWTPNPEVPVSIIADSAADFVNKINAALGGNPHTDVDPSFNAELTDGKITKVNYTLKTTIRRPRHAGGRASAEDKALIDRIVEFIKAHEERHRDLARAIAQQAVCDALGQTAAAGKKIISDADCKKMPTAQETLDASEGKIELTPDQKDFKAVSVKVNYHDPNCK